MTDSEAYPVSYPMGTGGCYPAGKAAGVWRWPLTSAYCRRYESVELYLQSTNTSYDVVLG